MSPLIISCLSQKGGVGKSTITRLIARTYAVAGWNVLICDFNSKQLSSLQWGRRRAAMEINPSIDVKPFIKPTQMRNEPYDLVVADGRPDSPQVTLDMAEISDLIVLPTGVSIDDLEPQLALGKELVECGIPIGKILFVLNKTADSRTAVTEARAYLSGFNVANQEIVYRISYQRAQNHGKALSEVGTYIGSLEDMADTLAAEIVDFVNQMEKTNG